MRWAGSGRARTGAGSPLTVTVAEAGSYKPAHGHWRAFLAAIVTARALRPSP